MSAQRRVAVIVGGLALGLLGWLEWSSAADPRVETHRMAERIAHRPVPLVMGGTNPPPLDGGAPRVLHFVVLQEPSTAAQRLRVRVRPSCTRDLFEGLTDETGRFALPGIPRDCELTLDVPGYTSQLYDDDEVELRRPASRNLSLQIVNAVDGGAIEWARVDSIAFSNPWTSRRTSGCATNADGRCALDRPEDAHVRLSVSAAGYVTTTVQSNADLSEQVIALSPSRRLTVMVEPAEALVRRVWLLVSNDEEAHFERELSAGGSFEFDDVPQGELAVAVAEQRWGRAVTATHVPAGSAPAIATLTLTPRRLELWADLPATERDAVAQVARDFPGMGGGRGRSVAVACPGLQRILVPLEASGTLSHGVLEYAPAGPCRVSMLLFDPRGLVSNVDDLEWTPVEGVSAPASVTLRRRSAH